MKNLKITLLAFAFSISLLAVNLQGADNESASGKCCAAKASSSCPASETCPKAGSDDCPMAKPSCPMSAEKAQAACPTLKNATAETGTCPSGKANKAKKFQVRKLQKPQHKGAYYLAQR